MKTPSPPPASEPHDIDDPLLDADAESHRALALLWLAESTPLSAAPADALTDIRAQLNLAPAPAAPRRRSWPVLAIGGWAAAACLAILLWRRSAPEPEPRGRVPAPEIVQQKVPAPPRPEKAAPEVPAAPPSVQRLTDSADLRRQITELRSALRATEHPAPGTHRPVIRELRPPGSTAPAISDERIRDIIATAFESELRRGSAANEKELVIESGWANWSTALPADTVRHRRFPRERWASLGLLHDPEGQFLDPATGWLWSPDPDSTDYVGRVAPADLDRSRFAATALAPAQRNGTAMVPAGYLVSGAGGQTILALSNLPAVPEGATLSVTSLSLDGNSARFSLPLGAGAHDASWDFSGFVPTSAGDSMMDGFSVEMVGPDGSLSTILSTDIK